MCCTHMSVASKAVQYPNCDVWAACCCLLSDLHPISVGTFSCQKCFGLLSAFTLFFCLEPLWNFHDFDHLDLVKHGQIWPASAQEYCGLSCGAPHPVIAASERHGPSTSGKHVSAWPALSWCSRLYFEHAAGRAPFTRYSLVLPRLARRVLPAYKNVNRRDHIDL